MPSLSLTGNNFSKNTLLILGVIFAITIAAVLMLVYLTAQKAQNRLISNQELSYNPPTTPSKRAIKKIRARRFNNGQIETVEISENGQVCIYNEDGSLQKCANQGFGRTQSLFDNFNKLMDGWLSGFSLGGNYLDITIVTNMGDITINVSSGSGASSGSSIQDIIDVVDDYVEDTFAPTPTIIPTATQSPNPPTATPTSSTPPPPSPTPWTPSFPGEPSPTPIPPYLLYPPFSCDDYQFSGPFTISNIMCNTE